MLKYRDLFKLSETVYAIRFTGERVTKEALNAIIPDSIKVKAGLNKYGISFKQEAEGEERYYRADSLEMRKAFPAETTLLQSKAARPQDYILVRLTPLSTPQPITDPHSGYGYQGSIARRVSSGGMTRRRSGCE